LLGLSAPSGLRAQVVEVAPFQVAPPASGYATNSIDAAVGADGNILFAWDEGTNFTYRGRLLPHPTNSMRVRLFSPDGAALGDITQVDTTGGVSDIAVAPNGDGYLTTWVSVRAATNEQGYNLYLNGRRLDRLGMPASFEFRVDADTTSIKGAPVVAGLDSGASVVLYYFYGDMMAAVFDAESEPVAPPFVVASPGSFHAHDVVGLANGDFAIGWSTYPSTSSAIRIFAPDGTPRTAPIDVSQIFLVDDVAANPDGGFAVIGRTADFKELWLRYFDDDGTPLTGDIFVHERMSSYYIANQSAAFDLASALLVQWFDYTSQGHTPLYGASFDPKGLLMSGETETASVQGIRLRSETLRNGQIVNFWTWFSEKSANIISICDPLAGECVEPGTTPSRTPTATRFPSPTPTPVTCGNGMLDEGEECDDANRLNGDGCDSRCLGEQCGNGRLEGLEQCDDGNGEEGDGCQNDCTHTPVHDSVILPQKPVEVSLRGSEIIKSLPLSVYNADDSPPESPGHLIQVIAADGTCPPGTIQGQPDFNRDIGGDQDTLNVAGGTRSTARVAIRATTDSFPGLDRKVPRRCTLSFSARAAVSGSYDPTPENNTIAVELNVYAGSNELVTLPPGTELPEFSIRSLKPLKVSIPKGNASSVKTLRFTAVASELPAAVDRLVGVGAGEGTCPAGTVGIIRLEGQMQDTVPLSAGRNVRGDATLVVSASAFHARGRRLPARCTASFTASSPFGDSKATSHTTNVLIEVFDRNDY
jgi:cysteine-rich repeat protein